MFVRIRSPQLEEKGESRMKLECIVIKADKLDENEHIKNIISIPKQNGFAYANIL